MEIHQIIVSASPGDAITTQALEFRSLLRRVCPSEVFARFLDPALESEVLPLTRYPDRRSSRGGNNVLLYHASIGQADIRSFLLERSERVVLIYHNISPPEYFIPYDPRFAALLAEGRIDLSMLRPRVTLALAVSAFNAAELRSLGYTDVRVSPPVIDCNRMTAMEPHQPTAQHLADQVEGPVLLFVGQVLPHKRPDFLLQAFHILATHLVPEAHLAMIGSARLPRYEQTLQTFLREANLPNAWLCGSRTQEELVAFFRRADAFVTASEHEGFCVPLVEAMAFGIPIVARRFAAIPETLDDCGIALPKDAGPSAMAEAMAMMCEDRQVGGELSARGRTRMAAFDATAARKTFLDHLASVV